jgi:predicted  nucleic acid-binding Zn-ribbon protein
MDKNLGVAKDPVFQSEKRLAQMEKGLIEKIDGVDKRVAALDRHVVEKFGEIRRWMMGLSVAQAASLLLVIAKDLKWI